MKPFFVIFAHSRVCCLFGGVCMTQLVKSPQNTLSLAQKMREGLLQIKQEKQIIRQQEGIIFLLDLSGSMSEAVEDGKPKIAHLEKVMRDYPSVRKVGFSDSVFQWQPGQRPAGNTDMAAGFRHLQTLLPKPAVVVLISDGEPNNPDDAVQEALKLHIPVNIIFMGDKGSQGEAFMMRLATLTGGKEFTAQSNTPQFGKHLKAGISGLLTGAGG